MYHDIDFGISLYGFTEQFTNDDNFGFEEMFQIVNKLGIRKVELVGAQMFRQYPNPSDEEISEVLRLAEKYDIRIFSYGAYVDFARYSDHDMTDDEVMNELRFELSTAHKLGCEYMRGGDVPVERIPELAQLAELYGVKVGCEIHAPSRPSDPDIQAKLHAYEELGSPWVGFVPDFGCYIERPNEIHIQRFLNLGAKPENLDFIIENRWNGYTEESMTRKMEEMGGGEAEKMAVSELFGYLSFAPADLEGFKTVLPHAQYFHGKFYHIGEDCVETTIPYEKLLGLIAESGFKGTIMIEYEGHCFYLNDAEEQIARHIQMEKNIVENL